MTHGTAAERAVDCTQEPGTPPAPTLTVVSSSSRGTSEAPATQIKGEAGAPTAEAATAELDLLELPTIRYVSYRQARIRLVLQPGGRLKRYVFLDSERLRILLGQPHCREIDEFPARHEHFELRTSELWAIGQAKAKAELRELYQRIRQREEELESTRATEEGTRAASDALAAPRPAPTKALRAPGKTVAPTAAREDSRGELLEYWYGGEFGFGLDLYDRDTRSVIRIEDIDLLRAFELSQAEMGDVIRVLRKGTRDVVIREQRTGSHGTGKREIRGKRTLYEVIREEPREMANAHRA
jgi:hypothetical protein